MQLPPQPPIYGWEELQYSFTFMNNIFQKEKWFSSTTTGKVNLSKIDSLGFLGEGKENWTIFSWPHCGIFKTSNEKAPHKLDVKIAKKSVY